MVNYISLSKMCFLIESSFLRAINIFIYKNRLSCSGGRGDRYGPRQNNFEGKKYKMFTPELRGMVPYSLFFIKLHNIRK